MKSLFFVLFIFSLKCTSAEIYKDSTLRIIIIRHGEKPLKGENLTCQGLNRSLQLPAVIKAKFGIPDFVYVPSLVLDSVTRHARMFETIIPLVSEFNIPVNSKFAEWDSTALARDIKQKKGVILIVWEHKLIPSLVRALGVSNFKQAWPDTDYDSIWILTITNRATIINYEQQGLTPPEQCPP